MRSIYTESINLDGRTGAFTVGGRRVPEGKILIVQCFGILWGLGNVADYVFLFVETAGERLYLSRAVGTAAYAGAFGAGVFLLQTGSRLMLQANLTSTPALCRLSVIGELWDSAEWAASI